ncbi:MAG: protein-glutamate O-methyltransferase CheR [Methylobacterium sp.]|jgi:chemotaxis protein methyltransferase CheR|nr:protein-glutamate O-methyltransferase CheR [Methylobacterium sp.]MCE2933076.1 protein-glutamate O-methyltransferase CheR [Hyphomicrobiales bacterium]MCA3643722.1 protein-glutamate O-methyltransferase CheR [Methylobacterium sp.]MCA3647585.1 protein-glutamate O-methyltransferase CheR [Methylobacterium sp.]MCA3653343.1 protein-glutamate O-methyltransferase CheR [Methylobacterium sp.]
MSIHAIQKTIEFIKQAAGIVLTPEKAYFVEARLAPVLREENIASLDDLLRRVETGDRRLQQRVIDALTTNETFFFRDRQPFDHFRDVIMPELHQRRSPEKTIRIWCAACSSGQEPFSLVMLLDEMRARIGSRQVEIVATDISEAILSKAKAGLFNQFEVQRGLPTKLLLQFFQKQGDNWKISDDVVRRVSFQKFNLMDDPRPLGTFDAIFCRNVLIYFDRLTRSKVFDKLASRLAPDGFLLLGGAESTFGVTERFVSHARERMLLVPAPVQKPELRIAGA